jgi:hypothetical protein
MSEQRESDKDQKRAEQEADSDRSSPDPSSLLGPESTGIKKVTEYGDRRRSYFRKRDYSS